MIETSTEAIDFSRIVRPGDVVFWGHGTSEPVVLTEALLSQRARIGRFGAFIGLTLSSTLRQEHADCIDFSAYCGIGANQVLESAGALQIVPCSFSQLPDLIADGILRCDVALLQLSGTGVDGSYRLAVSNDYMVEAAARARVVVAELNEAAPRTFGGDLSIAGLRIDYLVRSARPVVEVPSRVATEVEQRIARNVASLVPDRSTLQIGIGTVPQAILAELRGHRDLGLHSGMIGDGLVDLVEAGAMTNAYKGIDPGVSITGMLVGTRRLYEFADLEPALRLEPARYTHGADVLARLQGLCSINAAIEVDLSGQVNAELVGDRYVGAVGGQSDFVRAAQRSRGGRAIIALPSTAAGGARSRIVARLSSGVVTTPRCDADLIVTEWGVADLRGRTLPERARRMLAIAHPDFREELGRLGHSQGLRL